MNSDMINLADYGIRGINYYWLNRDRFNISTAELRAVGVEGNFAYINKAVVPAIQAANDELRQRGLGIIVKDGYRSPELYKLVQEKRYELDGKENTDRTLNTVTMPHASGYVLDVNLYDLESGEELNLWNQADWPDGIFAGFYKDKTDPDSRKFQELQDLLIDTMQRHGFELGSKNEIWHFELKNRKPERLLKETYLKSIENSVGTEMFRNLYLRLDGKTFDATEDGNLSCAFYVSGLLVIFALIERIHGTIESTERDLKASGWQLTADPTPGSIIVWERSDGVTDTNGHEHIGFYIGHDQAVSTSSSTKKVAKHHWTFDGTRRVKAIYASPLI